MTDTEIALFVGIDVSKYKLAVALAEAGTHGDALYLGTFENSPASVAKLLKKLSGRGRVCGCYEKAAIALANKLARIAWSILRHGASFDVARDKNMAEAGI